MLVIEIPPNPNCEPVDLRVFHDLEPPKPVAQVRVERPGDTRGPQWCAVTGWTSANAACPALARKVDDSGEGVVLLISGGDAGLRFQAAAALSRGGWMTPGSGARPSSCFPKPTTCGSPSGGVDPPRPHPL